MTGTELQSSAIIAVGTSEAIQWAKNSPWFPWLTSETQKANRVISLLVAFLSGLGMSFHFDPNAGTLLVSGLAWSALAHGAQQWVAQQAWYRLAVTRNDATLTPTRTGTTIVTGNPQEKP